MKKNRNGKVQFIAALEVITMQINAGHSGIHIYETLTASGRITLSYRQFQRYLSEHITPDKSTHPAPGKNVMNRSHPPSVQPSGSKPGDKGKTPQEPSPQKDIFRQPQKVLHNPSMTDERRKELFGE